MNPPIEPVERETIRSVIVLIGLQIREIGRTGAGFDHDFPVDDRGIDGECLQGIGYVRAEFTGPVETPAGQPSRPVPRRADIVCSLPVMPRDPRFRPAILSAQWHGARRGGDPAMPVKSGLGVVGARLDMRR